MDLLSVPANRLISASTVNTNVSTGATWILIAHLGARNASVLTLSPGIPARRNASIMGYTIRIPDTVSARPVSEGISVKRAATITVRTILGNRRVIALSSISAVSANRRVITTVRITCILRNVSACPRSTARTATTDVTMTAFMMKRPVDAPVKNLLPGIIAKLDAIAVYTTMKRSPAIVLTNTLGGSAGIYAYMEGDWIQRL